MPSASVGSPICSALRFCIVNFRTSTGDIEAMPELTARLGRKVHDELSNQLNQIDWHREEVHT
jgi:hypothetical protein